MSDTIKIKGQVHNVLPTQEFNSGFKKRVLVIRTDDKYPQLIPVEYVKDKCELLDGLMPNQYVVASVNLRGSEYNGKYYAGIQGWQLDKGKIGDGPLTKEQVKEALSPNVKSAEVEDDIPF